MSELVNRPDAHPARQAGVGRHLRRGRAAIAILGVRRAAARPARSRRVAKSLAKKSSKALAHRGIDALAK